MAILAENTTAAERALRATFAARHRSQAEVALNGGTVYGTPSFDIVRALVTLNGTTDYIKYDLRGDELRSPELSFSVEFWPDFETDEDVSRYIFDTTGADRYYIFKADNASLNYLVLRLGNTLIAAIPEAAYGPYWLKNQRNILVISSVSGNTNAWLNGPNNILFNDFTAWAAKRVADLYVGAAFNGTAKFKGKIGQVKIFQSLLTEQDAINFYSNTTYKYLDNAVVNLQMRACDHDPTNVRTLDVSGAGNHATLVGVTKRSSRGYVFDGVNDLLSGLPALTGNYTVATSDDSATVTISNTDTLYNTIRTAGAYSGALRSLVVIDGILTPLQEADLRLQTLEQHNVV